jgi:hypothetical protein
MYLFSWCQERLHLPKKMFHLFLFNSIMAFIAAVCYVISEFKEVLFLFMNLTTLPASFAAVHVLKKRLFPLFAVFIFFSSGRVYRSCELLEGNRKRFGLEIGEIQYMGNGL